jgi:hypothetical protein
MKNNIYIIVLIFLFSCENDQFPKPKDLLSKQEMTNLLYDMHVANKTIRILSLDSVKDRNYFSLAAQKHKTDTTRFKKSHAYYMHNIEEYRVIYDDLQLKVETELKQKQAILRTKDSIKIAKRKKERKSKFSEKDKIKEKQKEAFREKKKMQKKLEIEKEALKKKLKAENKK